jgi:protein-disulfide isomerase
VTDDKTKQLLDRNRLFLELQQLTIDEYKIKQRIMQEGERAETLGEDFAQEFTKLRRQMAKEKDIRKVVRDLFVLQEASAHAVAYLMAKNNESIMAVLSEKLSKSQ